MMPIHRADDGALVLEGRRFVPEERIIALVKAAREVEMNAGFRRDRNAAMVGVLRMAARRAALEALDK